MRYLMLALVVCIAVVVAATAFGRAIDNQVQDRVMFTRDSVTFDCERRFVEAGEPIIYEDGSSRLSRGEIHYMNCHTAP